MAPAPQSQQPSVSVFSGLATQTAMETEIFPAFTERTGVPVDAVFDPTTELQRRIEGGERPDLTVVADSSIPDLAATGAVVAAGAVPLVTTGIGLAVPPGAPHPDIGDVDALVAALLAARSVAYSRAGQSGIYFRRLIAELGIAEQVEARATVLPKGFTATALVDGRADLAVQQLSELATVPEAEIVGPLPDAVQHTTTFCAVLGAEAQERAEVLALLRFLRADLAREAYARTHLQPQ